MSGLADAFSEVKNLPDEVLQRELAAPSGSLPSYIVLGEMHERKNLRSGTGHAKKKPKSLAEEYIGDFSQYKPYQSPAMATPAPAGAAMPPPAPVGGVGISSLQPPTVRGFASGGIVSLNGGIRDRLIATANAIGADPLDLATAISYETGGTFNPTQPGPRTQWGQHRGFIQFGEPQARQHGVDWSDPVNSQLGPDGAVASYMRSSGFKPGMSGLDLYSTINAGAPGKYGASDANNGGAPGDVRDKWENQMAGHRAKAQALLGGDYQVQSADAATVSQGVEQGGAAVDAAAPVAAEDPMSEYMMMSMLMGGQQKAPAPAMGGGGAPQQSVRPFDPSEYIQDPEFIRRRMASYG